MGYKNKEKQKEYQRVWFQKNKEKHQQQAQDRRNLRKRFIQKYKTEHPCEICGENTWQCLDFHHKNPKEKIKSISIMCNFGYTISILKKKLKNVLYYVPHVIEKYMQK